MSRSEPRTDAPLHAHPLEELLLRLEGFDTPTNGSPELLIIHRPPPSGTGAGAGEIECRPLHGIDPVAELIGIEPDHSWQVVGVRAPAVGRRLPIAERGADGTDDQPMACAFVHLIGRDGTSITELSIPGTERIRLGPDRTIREGRIADACRRVFELPTAPPSDMARFIIDAWLTLVLRSALMTPGLRWEEIVGLCFPHHLAAGDPTRSMPTSTTPAALARSLQETAATLDWGRYRHACIALGGCPVSDLTPAEIGWMDTGMFARWAQSALPVAEELIELLEPTLDPVALDRLLTTMSLIGRRSP